MGKLTKISLVFLFILSPFSVQNVVADSRTKTIQSFINLSLKLKLYEQAAWRDLLHYRPNNFSSGYTSQADSFNFFYDKNGKFDPKAELVATLQAMFKPVLINKPNEHPQCLFVARKNWLIDKLPTINKHLPVIQCSEYEKWIGSINPHSVTLAFPSAYINNPGSMFGHTLLRVDQPESKEKNYLTSYAITYAANTSETNGLAFAIKGLAGGYPGLFSILPYYDKVNEYNDLENRDIWEYELDLTPKESQRMLQHMWELRTTIFDYYFLDENCSYQLLALLDVARPGLNLAAAFPIDVIPADTVRVIANKNIIKKINYRPSLLTNLKYQLENYSGKNLALILDLVEGKKIPTDSHFNSLNEHDKIYTLEIAYNYLQYKYKSNELARAEYAKRSLTLLKARNKLSPEINIPVAKQPAIRPEQGHKSARLLYSYGSKANQDFIELNWRPAYHDLLDNNDGFVDGLQINFLDIFARINTNRDKIYLQKFDFVNIYSLKPRTQFFKPISWKFNISYRRLPVLNDINTLVFNLNGGAGVSYQLLDSLRAYALIESTVLMHRRFKDVVSASLGPNIGFLWQVTPNWKMWLDATSQTYDKNNNLTYQKVELGQSFVLSKNQSIRLNWLQESVNDNTQNEIKASLNWYY
ncbi:putative outermembrane protein [hydrothermal vent metagenome]|uniref:Putative outermembrane protein n=1 Tax=hydrothermal vent metagenome TaxID=652676 RepID=A0A3B1A3K3_9ZZZZ